MKTLKLINSSRILKTALVLIMLLLIVSFAATWLVYGDHPVDKKSIGQFAEIIVPFGQYDKIHVIDGEEGVFLVREEKGGTLKLVNTEGNMLADLAPATDLVQQKGDLLMLSYKEDYTGENAPSQLKYCEPVINYREMINGKPLPETEIATSQLHESGKYYYWQEWVAYTSDYRLPPRRQGVSAADGTVLYEAEVKCSIWLLNKEGFMRRTYYEDQEQLTEIVNLYTGEVLDTKGHDVIDGNGYLWICGRDNPLRQNERYVVGADFEELEEDFTGEDLYFSDDGKYLFGQMCVSSPDGERVEAKSFVADAYGNIIYEESPRRYFQYGAEGDIEFVDIAGDKLLRRHYLADDKTRCDYIDLLTMERKEIGGEPVFSAMDSDDGITLCAVAKEWDDEDDAEVYNGQRLSRYTFEYMFNALDSDYTRGFDWYFADDEGKVYDFVFEGALPSREGYAAVRSEKKWGVIRFKDAV